jgi:RNA polymerase sigma-70 factor (ECF subfamily)
VVHHRVARVLALTAARRSTPPGRQHLLDLVQDVFVLLLDPAGRVIRAWEPERGLSLENFVGLVAEREAQSFVRSGRRSAWAECPEEDVAKDRAEPGNVEELVAARQELDQLYTFVSERLSPKGVLLFRALFVARDSIEETSAQFSMTATAVYTFRSRFRDLIRQWHARQAHYPGSGAGANEPRVATEFASASGMGGKL